jgi:hypothetical protein
MAMSLEGSHRFAPRIRRCFVFEGTDLANLATRSGEIGEGQATRAIPLPTTSDSAVAAAAVNETNGSNMR